MWRPLVIAFFFYTTPMWFALHGFFDYYNDYWWALWDYDPVDSFDFVIVGAGSAGATIAHRLSKHNRVLLIEAGGHPYWMAQVPGVALDLTRYSYWDWMHSTVPQNHAGLALKNNVSIWPRGKVLGGSSTLNYMLYLRGHPMDYDNWAKTTNDSEWSYDNLLPYFKKSLKSYKGKYKENTKHYSESPYGFLHIESMRWSAYLKEFFSAGEELGFPEIDANGPQTSGFGPLEVTQKDGERHGLYSALLQDLIRRKSVKILTYAQATKIDVDKTGRAVGIYYSRHGKQKYVTATKEIIISAGTVDSPKLLMLSGIGPSSHLRSVGIKPKIDLPVGKNLQDHPVACLIGFTTETSGVFPSLDHGFFNFMQEYSDNRTGPLTVAGGVNAQGFFCSEDLFAKKSTTPKDCKWPDLQVYYVPVSYFSVMNSMITRALDFDPDFLNAINPPTNKEGFHLLVSAVRPLSVGEIKLKTKDPFDLPVINPNYFENPKDLQVMLKGVKLMLQMAENTSMFQNIGTKYISPPAPGCEHLEFRSDEYWICHLKQVSVTMWHPTGTCKMGRDASDPSAVVDSRLRVLHTRGLRVADASIMPSIVNANTNAPTIMIGERAAAFILQYWADQYLVSDTIEHYFLYQDAKCYYSKTI